MAVRRHRRRLLGGAGALLTLAGLVAAYQPAGAALPTAHLPTSVTRAPTLPAQIDYVALGDSYSAGPLIEPQRPDPIGCLRSTQNYPAYIAGFLGVATYRDVTCSGAEVKDFFGRQSTIIQGPSPAPQVEALSAATDLVTVGIGGNDFGLFGSLIDTCERVRPQDPTGAPCKKHFTVEGVDTKSRDARRIQGNVSRGLAPVKKAAPHARIYIVGYPRLLPERGTCAAVPFATGDYAWGRGVERLLNRSVRLAAEAQHVTYVNLYPASLHHDACARDPWINGSKIDYTMAANFHPFRRGERGFARAVYTRITGKPSPMDADAMPPAGSIIPNLPG